VSHERSRDLRFRDVAYECRVTGQDRRFGHARMIAQMFDTCQDIVRHNETMSDWIPVQDATARYGVSRATLYRLISEGRVRRGRRAGDARSYVSSLDLKNATTIRAVGTAVRGPRRSPRRSTRRG